MSAKAELVTSLSACVSGTVPIVAYAPNRIIDWSRPMRSGSAPNGGCNGMYTSSAQVMTLLVVFAGMPAVLARYFCM